MQVARAAEPAGTPRIFQCVLPDGKKLTSDKPIAECMNVGKAQRELNNDGSEKGVVEAPPTEDEKAERDRIRRQREAEKTAHDIEVRRDRDMLKRFPDAAAHGKARAKALDDVGSSVRNSEARIKLLLEDRKPLMEQAEFYAGRPLPSRLKQDLDAIDAALEAQRSLAQNPQTEARIKLLQEKRKPLMELAEPYAGKPLPTHLKQDIDANDAALAAQRSLVQNQQTEVIRINGLYDLELARLKKLWAGAPAGSIGPAPSTPPTAAAAAAAKPALTAVGAKVPTSR